MTSFACKDPSTVLTCPETCQGLTECNDCECVVIDSQGGPWGDAMDVIFCLLPIFFLLVATLKPKPLPTTQSLPMAALFMFLVRLMYLGSDPVLVAGSIISGFHEALAPLSIMGGAILLFETMENSLCMPFMMREMKVLTNGHPCAEGMLLFCFAYMVEGASGFGTPAALGAPMLVSLGYPKMEAVVALLLMNTFATVWGAVGTPIWFGFGNLDLTEDDFIEISYRASICLAISAFLLVPTLVLRVICPWKTIMKNIVFVILSLMTVILPSLGLSFVSYEFPSLLGGMLGFLLTAALIQCKIGLKEVEEGELVTKTGGETNYSKGDMEAGMKNDEHSPEDDTEDNSDGNEAEKSTETKLDNTSSDEASEDETDNDIHKYDHLLGSRKTLKEGYLNDVLMRTFPLWGTVILLVLTRVPQIGLKELLTKKENNLVIHFGSYGTFRLSSSLVFQLNNILGHPKLNWKYELLYIPCLIPFVVISVLTMVLFRRDLQKGPSAIVGTALKRLRKPAIALMGALALVQLLIRSGPASPASLIGTNLANALQGGWIAIAAFIGALGSFFSGSTTVSNLTFGEVQLIASKSIGTSTTALLGLQAVGGSAGNGICINNIIAACAVVGLNVGEGRIIARTGPCVVAICIVSTVVLLALFFRF